MKGLKDLLFGIGFFIVGCLMTVNFRENAIFVFLGGKITIYGFVVLLLILIGVAFAILGLTEKD